MDPPTTTMVRYFCSVLGNRPSDDSIVLLVSAPSAKVARAYATRRLGTKSLIVHPAGGMAGVDVELRVVEDASPDGRVEAREKRDDVWSDWRTV